MIFLCSPQPSKPGKYDSLLFVENIFKLRDKILDDPVGHIQLHIIGLCIKGNQLITLLRSGPEEETPVWWIDRT